MSKVSSKTFEVTEDGRALVLRITTRSGDTLALSSPRFRMWAAQDGVPIGSLLVDTDIGDASVHGSAVFDETAQTISWVLPDGGYPTPGTFVGIFTAELESGDLVMIPSPEANRVIYCPIAFVQVGPES